MHHVSWRRGRQTEYQTSIRKFLDRSRDSVKRLKALRIGLEKSSAVEVKQFYKEHSTDVFYVVFGAFTTLETSIQDKVLKGKGSTDVLTRELTDLVLPHFQQILVSLPELIHKKWQFNSICLVIRKLLHPENHMKLRQYGVQLLVLWVQALQENAGDPCMELFASFIPYFPPHKTPMGLPLNTSPSAAPGSVQSSLGERYGVYTSTGTSKGGMASWGVAGNHHAYLHRSSSAILLGASTSPPHRECVCPNMLTPLVPRPPNQAGEECSETEQLVLCVLESLTQLTTRLHWDDSSAHLRGFSHLFFLFKLFYLACLYKEFRSDSALYSTPTPPQIELSSSGQPLPSHGLHALPEEPESAETTPLSVPSPTAGGSSPRSAYKSKRNNPYRMSSVIKLEYDLSNPVYTKVKNLVLIYVLRWFLPNGQDQLKDVPTHHVIFLPPPVVPEREGEGLSGAELMRQMWFTTKDNVKLLLEICRQGFSTLSEPLHKRLLVDLYRHWIQAPEKPPFMESPSSSRGPSPITAPLDTEERGRVLSWEQLSRYEGFVVEGVEAGVANSLAMVIAHTQQVFLLTPGEDTKLKTELCRKVIRLYQDIAVGWLLDKVSWEYLLSVLLYHTHNLLTHKDTALGMAMANSILKTLLICFLRVSMATEVNPALWDKLVLVLHSLTHWKEVIIQWKVAMDSMTEVLAQAVYNLNLQELPLEVQVSGHGRPRAVSVTRPHRPAPPSASSSNVMPPNSTLSQLEIAPPRLTSFSSIFEGPPSLHPHRKPSKKHPPLSKLVVEGGASGGRVKLSRSATQQERSSPTEPSVTPLKRHSTPSGSLQSRPPLLSAQGRPSAIEEDPSESLTPKKPALPYQRLQEEGPSEPRPSKEPALLYQRLKEDGSSEPHPSKDPALPYQLLQEDESEEEVIANVNAASPSPIQDVARATPSPQGGVTFLRRSGSDEIHRMSPPLSATSQEDQEVGVASGDCGRVTFSMRKSSSDGNINRVIPQHDYPLPTPPSTTTPSADRELALRRVVTVASPTVTPGKLEGGETSPTNSDHSAGTSSKRPLRKSMTMDSPEHLDDAPEHVSPPPTSLSPTGGQAGGWSPRVAATVWLRMLSVLGNVNDIRHPVIHWEAMLGLYHVWTILSKIRANSGVNMSGHTTPPLPEYMPPLELFLPWVVEACQLPQEFRKGRETAYQLLCELTITHWHTSPHPSHLPYFYHLMHLALQPESDMCAVAVRYGCQLFAHELSGSSVLLLDCVAATEHLLAAPNSEAPHNEALYLLGSLLFLPDLYSTHTLPSPAVDGSLKASEEPHRGDLKERIIGILFQAAIKESSRISRCIALHLVGMLVFSELQSGQPSSRLPEGIDILLQSLQFADRGVSMAAIDMMSLLSDVGVEMFRLYPSMPLRVLQAICYAIAVFLMEELEHAAWVDKVIVTLLLLLRDWLMVVLPLYSTQDTPPSATDPQDSPRLLHDTVKTVFEVLQAAAGSQQQMNAKRRALSHLVTIHTPVEMELDPLVTSSNSRSPGHASPTSPRASGRRDVQLSSERGGQSSRQQEETGRIQTAARSVLTHLLNLLGHFPFGCGAAQLSSSVQEHHDSPTLGYLDDITSEVFDSPRMQFFAVGGAAVVTLVEIPTQVEGAPGEASVGTYQVRVIVRDVSGKYTWDSTLLYGPDVTPEETCSMLSAESMDSLESVGASSEGVGGTDYLVPSSSIDSVQPPSWRTHATSDRDVLQDLLEHIELTSPECVAEPEGSQSNPLATVPVGVSLGKGQEEVEGALLKLLQQQQSTEQSYAQEALSQPALRGEMATAPRHFVDTPAFHHCCVLLNHLGLLSWDKRNHINLLEKTNQLILELKNLDLLPAQSRATYKVAVLYVGPGQEDKVSILSNSGGTRGYEDFVAGLGWEVNMETHAGYMAGMQKEFSSCSMPYYATSSEEVLFHVATRMTSKLEQKVRHLGNDEVHIVWSEHWRDYRRSSFRTQFADVLIVIYPLPSGLLRVQINKKPSVPQFGPLFDGAVVDRSSVAPLVRATAINALRAQRSPLIGYRGRYEERLKYIKAITSTHLHSTFEDFCENVMHPLEMSASLSTQPPSSASAATPSPQKHMLDGSTSSSSSLTNLLRSFARSSHHLSSSSTHLAPHLPAETAHLRTQQRQRSSTNDDRMACTPDPGDVVLVRNASVPDSLNSTLSASDLASSSSPRPPSARSKGRDSPLLSSPGNRRKQGLNESLSNSTKTQGLVTPPYSKPF